MKSIDAKSDDIEDGDYCLPAMDTSGDLKGISENKEQLILTPISSTASPTKPHHGNQDSMSTPFGDMDTNTTINLRAKHRRTSSLMKRSSSEFSMKNYGDIVWRKLAVLSGRGDTLTQRQFDIELQNNDILGDPDICGELFKTIQSDNPINKKQINKGMEFIYVQI